MIASKHSVTNSRYTRSGNLKLPNTFTNEQCTKACLHVYADDVQRYLRSLLYVKTSSGRRLPGRGVF